MAQAATMGPPLSPREIRRSGRRSAPSANSKSPDSDLPPRQKENTHRPSQSTSAANRNKRTKDDPDDHPDDRKHPASATHSSASNSSSANSKGRRKNKDKDREKQRLSIDITADTPQESQDSKAVDPVEEEEQGITRCVCGSNGEDETDAGEFMVQCETCKVWQHGLCMGYESEDQVHDADYYCELCRPELHGELFKRLAKKARQSSTVTHATAASRVSRSHSPTHLLKQPSKRRNTMNSRDANFDESLKEIIEATAAEAAAAQENATQQQQPQPLTGPKPDPEEEPEVGSHNRKKRKRTDDDASSKKRTRSTSSASDQQPSSIPRIPSPPPKIAAPPHPKKLAANTGKRFGRRAALAPSAADAPAPLDGAESVQPATTTTTTTTTTKRQGGYSRAKGSGTTRRPPISHSTSHGNSNMNQELSSRRGQSHNVTGQGNSALESTRTYRNSHAYAVSQQPLFTSWGLPDYLAHLEEMLPTNVPQPLEIQSGSGTTSGRGESTERTMERGVKVKWPSKRMSVGDMNKRVRALVEWVGREQANALDRERRREALGKALKHELETSGKDSSGAGDDTAMTVDGSSQNQNETQGKPAAADSEQDTLAAPATIRAASTSANVLWKSDDGKPLSTMKMMEELMEELIGFQERFGPGAKTRERERRIAS